MPRTTFRIPLRIEGSGLCALDLDLLAALRAIGERGRARPGGPGVPDAFALRVVEAASAKGARGGAIPARFSPAFQERLPLDAPGTPPPSWICRFPAGLGAEVPEAVAVRGTITVLLPPGLMRAPMLEFDVYDEAWAVQAPYPPNHFHLLLPDGRVPPVPFYPAATVAPLPEGRMEARIGGEPFFTYRHPPSARPYLFPVLGPSGDPLTRLGHPHDPTESHRHHRSL